MIQVFKIVTLIYKFFFKLKIRIQKIFSVTNGMIYFTKSKEQSDVKKL